MIFNVNFISLRARYNENLRRLTISFYQLDARIPFVATGLPIKSLFQFNDNLLITMYKIFVADGVNKISYV